jgi:hypothetical protein
MRVVVTSRVAEYGTDVSALVGSAVVSGRAVVASNWTDNFTTEGDSEGDGTLVASESSNVSLEVGIVDVSSSVTGYNIFFQLLGDISVILVVNGN